MPLISANGIRLRVEVLPHRRATRTPEATPLVFIHGLAASSGFWYGAGASVLTGQGPAVLYDLRGHGKSDTPEQGYSLSHMVDDLLAVMDAQHVFGAHLIAHSFGGMIALRAAVRAPERVRSLVLADTRIRPLQNRISIPTAKLPPHLAARLSEMGIVGLPNSENGDGIDYLKTVAKIQLAAGSEADALLSGLYQHPGLFRSRRNAQKWIALAERMSFAEDINASDSFTARDLQALTCPILALVGEKSPTKSSISALKTLCPKTYTVQIPGAGHFFPLAKPRAFLRPTWKFLRAVNRGESVRLTRI